MHVLLHQYNNIVGLSGHITGKHVYIAMCRSRTRSHGERAKTTYDPNNDYKESYRSRGCTVL